MNVRDPIGGLHSTLSWLPAPPVDFRRRCRALIASNAGDGSSIARLAGYGLGENHLQQLAGVIEAFRKDDRFLEPLTPFKLGIVGNGTLDHIVPALTASAARHGVALECVKADFSQTVQEALSPDSIINRSKPDAVLVALDYRGLPLRSGIASAASAESAVSEALSFVHAIRSGLRAHGNALSIVQTVPPPPETTFGSFDRLQRGSIRSLTAAFNAALVESVRDSGDVVLDVAGIAETVGLEQWFSPSQWNFAKVPFDSRFVPLYADHVGRLVGALRGKSRRCLILDLDNTIWGGVVGDDGLDGIVLGQGDATGEAYVDVQRTALALRDRGVVLAVSSKNADAIARAVFQSHPDMLLRENHITVFQANWDDKPTNIRAIAKELGLGLDALVLLDDNPAERALVREVLPDVAVPELPDDPALYARTLAAAGYFEAVAFSDEDRKRAAYYEADARRVALQGSTLDVATYLASLRMEIDFRPFDAAGRSRIAQLINKSNQFNLTTRRYTEADVAALESDPAVFTLQVRLMDAFGDNGIISVVICRERSDEEWEIDTWLMSCRVLGRGVERAVLREVLMHARERGVRRVVGMYVPTDRNALVRDLYEQLAFRRTFTDASGMTTWEIDADHDVDCTPMSVTRAAHAIAARGRTPASQIAPAQTNSDIVAVIGSRQDPCSPNATVPPNGAGDQAAVPQDRAPGSATENVLATIWAQEIGVDRIGVRDNFLALGGHSLIAMRVSSRIRDTFRIDVPVRTVFEAPTVEQLTRALVALERKPGQVERIAKVMERAAGMSLEQLRVAASARAPGPPDKDRIEAQ